MRRLLLFLGGMDAAVRSTGSGTVDLNLLSVARLIDVPVVRYADFAPPGWEFPMVGRSKMSAGMAAAHWPARASSSGGSGPPLQHRSIDFGHAPGRGRAREAGMEEVVAGGGHTGAQFRVADQSRQGRG